MRISLKLEYACRVLIRLAADHETTRLAHLEDLASSEEVPANYLVQILNDLRGHGLVTSKRGKLGGYSLKLPPTEITLRDVVMAVEPDLLAVRSVSGGSSGEQVLAAWKRVSETLDDALQRQTVAAMAVGDASAMYYI